jgi:hypothetical protein
MDCRTARLLLDFARPRAPELPPSDADALDTHLAGCSECDALARAERASDARLAEAMRDVLVPDGLRDRILASLQTERGDRRRRALAWTVRAVAAAALVFLVAWLGSIWYGNRPRELDVWRLHDEVCYQPLDPDKVKAAFHEQYKIQTPIPAGFNYACLKFYGVVPCQGRSVPMLLFIRGEAEARVYVIASDQFDVKALNEAEPIDSGGYEVKIVPEDSDHTFVVIHKGELQPLLAHENAAQ